VEEVGGVMMEEVEGDLVVVEVVDIKGEVIMMMMTI
jgi:hypothetical protein